MHWQRTGSQRWNSPGYFQTKSSEVKEKRFFHFFPLFFYFLVHYNKIKAEMKKILNSSVSSFIFQLIETFFLFQTLNFFFFLFLYNTRKKPQNASQGNFSMIAKMKANQAKREWVETKQGEKKFGTWRKVIVCWGKKSLFFHLLCKTCRLVPSTVEKKGSLKCYFPVVCVRNDILICSGNFILFFCVCIYTTPTIRTLLTASENFVQSKSRLKVVISYAFVHWLWNFMKAFMFALCNFKNHKRIFKWKMIIRIEEDQ